MAAAAAALSESTPVASGMRAHVVGEHRGREPGVLGAEQDGETVVPRRCDLGDVERRRARDEDGTRPSGSGSVRAWGRLKASPIQTSQPAAVERVAGRAAARRRPAPRRCGRMAPTLVRSSTSSRTTPGRRHAGHRRRRAAVCDRMTPGRRGAPRTP